MKDIRIDDRGLQRCWSCGGVNFTQGRTTRAKVAVGVGALVTKKKLRCTACGEWNDVGSAKPYTGPLGAQYRRRDEAQRKAADKLAMAARAEQAARTAPPPAVNQTRIEAYEAEQEEKGRRAVRAAAAVRPPPRPWVCPAGHECHSDRTQCGICGARRPTSSPGLPPPPPPQPGGASLAEQLTQLADLYRTGALTDAEFALAKQRLLGTA